MRTPDSSCVFADPKTNKWRAVVKCGDIVDSPTFLSEEAARAYVEERGGTLDSE